MKERYCNYCRMQRPDEGFKQVFHYNSGTQRGMCPVCQSTRKKPRGELVALAEQAKAERKRK